MEDRDTAEVPDAASELWCILSLSSDPQHPVLDDREAKSALQGCSAAEGEKHSQHPQRCSGGQVDPPCLASSGWPSPGATKRLLPMALVCQQLIYSGLAPTASGKARCNLHPHRGGGKGLSNNSVSSRHLSRELTAL